MYSDFWSEYSILFSAAILGSIAILPYGLRIASESAKKKQRKIPQWLLLVLSILQNAVLFAVVVGIGLLAAHQIGLRNLLTTTVGHALIAVLSGALAGGVLLIMDLLFLPHLPEKLRTSALKTTQWENFSAAFYGGINEELLTRLFGVSVIVWLISRFWNTPSGLPTDGVFWTANILMALLFAVGHVPALRSLVEKITAALWARTLILNMVVGLLCGWLFWNYGIIPAMIAHFSADIIYHNGGTVVLRRKFPKHGK